MARSRSTFGKIQREQDRQNRAKAKREKRAARKDEPAEEGPTTGPEDQEQILIQLAQLHEDLSDGRISLEMFEIRQEELRSSLRID